jgi:ribosomal protein S18 acetylase RimI-like enzyme
MSDISIRLAGPEDAEKLHWALARLSADLGDPHLALSEDLLRHGFGEAPAFFALLAEEAGTDAVVGAALVSPVFSTSRGGAGLYISDLWVAASARGEGLGPKLLSAALNHAPANWSVRFLKLAVYDDNPAARAFYDRLGFEANPRETHLTLSGSSLEDLKETP